MDIPYRMLRDVEQFKTKMSKIEGSGDLGERLVELIQAKSVTAQASNNGTATGPSKDQPGEEGSTSGT